jgi:hypothetical protein
MTQKFFEKYPGFEIVEKPSDIKIYSGILPRKSSKICIFTAPRKYLP